MLRRNAEMDGDMSDIYFSEEKVKELITHENWELVRVTAHYRLRQKEKIYTMTMCFELGDDFAEKYLTGI